jgi:hypothetical protein
MPDSDSTARSHVHAFTRRPFSKPAVIATHDKQEEAKSMMMILVTERFVSTMGSRTKGEGGISFLPKEGTTVTTVLLPNSAPKWVFA